MPILPPTRPSTFYIGSVLINPKQILAWFLLLLIGAGVMAIGVWGLVHGYRLMYYVFWMIGSLPFFALVYRGMAFLLGWIFDNL